MAIFMIAVSCLYSSVLVLLLTLLMLLILLLGIISLLLNRTLSSDDPSGAKSFSDSSSFSVDDDETVEVPSLCFLFGRRCRRLGAPGRRNGIVPLRIVGVRETTLLSSDVGLSVVVDDAPVVLVRLAIGSRRALTRLNGGLFVGMVIDETDAIVCTSADAVSVVVFRRLLYRSFGTNRFRVVSEMVGSVVVDDVAADGEVGGSVVGFSANTKFGFSSRRLALSNVRFLRSAGSTRCRVGNRNRVYEAVVDIRLLSDDSGVGTVVELIRCRYSLMLNRGRFFGSYLLIAFSRVVFVAFNIVSPLA